MEDSQNEDNNQKSKNKLIVIFSRLIVVVSILWEIFSYLYATKIPFYGKQFFDYNLFIIFSVLPIIIIGMMWVFGVFKLKS